jgi:hypothetical protein
MPRTIFKKRIIRIISTSHAQNRALHFARYRVFSGTGLMCTGSVASSVIVRILFSLLVNESIVFFQRR